MEQAVTQRSPLGDAWDQHCAHYSIAAKRFVTIGFKSRGRIDTNAVSGGGTPPGSAAYALAPAVLWTRSSPAFRPDGKQLRLKLMALRNIPKPDRCKYRQSFGLRQHVLIQPTRAVFVDEGGFFKLLKHASIGVKRHR